jgi:uncharacterized protein YgiM (DUF1202 family)
MTRSVVTLAAALLVALLVAAPPARAAEPAAVERLRIADPYLELRTGPGRGYPIFHVSARDEWVEILLRHTDWFKVRAENGREGWVQRRQLETTLTEAGAVKGFRDVLVDDYLARRVELGAGWGQFDSEPMLKVWAGYRLSDAIAVEGTIGQVQGLFSGTDFWHLDLQVQPWSDKRLSPHLGVGFGQFRNIPNQSLVDAETTNAKLALATVGVRYHLTDRFVVRADYTLYTAFVADTRSIEYRAWTAGLAFFF